MLIESDSNSMKVVFFSSVCLVVFVRNFLDFLEGTFQSLQMKLFRLSRKNLLDFLEETFQSFQKELFRLSRKNFLDFLEKTFQPFRRNSLVPLEGTFQTFQKELCSPFKRNFLVHLDETFQSLEKELFTLFRRNFLDFLEGILGLLNFLDQKAPMPQSLFHYYCQSFLYILLQCLVYNYQQCKRNTKNYCVFFFFLTLAGL